MSKTKAATRACTPGSGENFENGSAGDQSSTAGREKYSKATSPATVYLAWSRFNDGGTLMTGRISPLIKLLASSHDGEAIGALRALERALDAIGRDFHWLGDIADEALAKPAPSRFSAPGVRPTWQIRAAQVLRERAGRLTGAEHKFLVDMTTCRGQPSGRQLRWLSALEQASAGRAAA